MNVLQEIPSVHINLVKSEGTITHPTRSGIFIWYGMSIFLYVGEKHPCSYSEPGSKVVDKITIGRATS